MPRRRPAARTLFNLIGRFDAAQRIQVEAQNNESLSGFVSVASRLLQS